MAQHARKNEMHTNESEEKRSKTKSKATTFNKTAELSSTHVAYHDFFEEYDETRFQAEDGKLVFYDALDLTAHKKGPFRVFMREICCVHAVIMYFRHVTC